MEKKYKFEYSDPKNPIDFMSTFNQIFETSFKIGEVYSDNFYMWQKNVNWFNNVIMGADEITILEVEND